MFKTIKNIGDVQAAVSDKTEIRFVTQPNGVTIGCYMFMDSKTFESPEALECRGIAFNANGEIVSRPLHKFFNMGEKEWLAPTAMLLRDDIAGIFEKIDGSMIATCFDDGVMKLRSKKSFNSHVVKLADEFLELPENDNIRQFAAEVAMSGMTAIFEITHPKAQIVVPQSAAQLRLLHVRDNVTGEYVMLDAAHRIHDLIKDFSVPMVRKLEGLELADAIDQLETMKNAEGYIVQFKNGDMMKIKCPWYLRLHASLTFMRERDIARLALNEELDDLKLALQEMGIDLCKVEEIEAQLKRTLSDIIIEVENIVSSGRNMDRKSFAIANQKHPYFGMAMKMWLGEEINPVEWYEKRRLKEDFGLGILLNDAVAEELA